LNGNAPFFYAFLAVFYTVAKPFFGWICSVLSRYFKHHESCYENISYLIRGEDFYKVTEHFPRIEEKDLMKGVGDVKYSIVLTAETEKHKTSFSNVIEKFKL